MATTANTLKNEQMIAKRLQLFEQNVGDVWDVDDVLFTLCLLLVIGASDNIAKNFYPYSFGVKKIEDGVEVSVGDHKWKLRNDDLDSILQSQNQGLDKKPYWMEFFDKYENGQYIVNAAEGAFIALFWRTYFTTQNGRGMTKMRQLLGVLEQLGGNLGSTHHEKLLSWYKKYYVAVKEKFPAALINEDMMRYENARIEAIKGNYNNDTNPLSQELGDHYTTEMGWMKKRLVYIMSMATFGDFSTDTTNSINFRINGNANLTLTPALAMYPTVVHGSTPTRYARTMEGGTCVIPLSGTDQDDKICGADWLLDIGDWSTMPINGALHINGKMLRRLVLGAASSANIANAITQLTLGNTVSIREVDIRNLSTLAGQIDLTVCKLLQSVKAEGTSVTNLILPEGAPLTEVQYPDSEQIITMLSLPVLTNAGVNYEDCAENVTNFLVSNCPSLSPMAMLAAIIKAQSEQVSHNLTRVYADGFDETSDDADLLTALAQLADGTYHAITREGMDTTGVPVLSGIITMTCPVYPTPLNALRNIFGAGGLVINAATLYIEFEEEEVERICSVNWGDFVETVVTTVISDESDVVNINTIVRNVHMNNTTRASVAEVSNTNTTRAKENGETAGTTTTTTKAPVGMTYAQAAAVSSVGTEFQDCPNAYDDSGVWYLGPMCSVIGTQTPFFKVPPSTPIGFDTNGVLNCTQYQYNGGFIQVTSHGSWGRERTLTTASSCRVVRISFRSAANLANTYCRNTSTGEYYFKGSDWV